MEMKGSWGYVAAFGISVAAFLAGNYFRPLLHDAAFSYYSKMYDSGLNVKRINNGPPPKLAERLELTVTSIKEKDKRFNAISDDSHLYRVEVLRRFPPKVSIDPVKE